MRNAPALILTAAALVALGGCKSRTGGFDEFAVARNAPLVIPPDYTLTPPTAGTISLTAEAAQAQAIEALFGGPAPRSPIETSMLSAAGRERALLGARSIAGDEDTRIVDKGAATQTILAAPQGNGREASAQITQ